MTGADDRGQAYTLESLIAALLLVTAVLFSLQAVVLEPDTSGTLGPDEQNERHLQASDALVTAANDGELSRLARYWDCSAGSPAFADSANESAGDWLATQGYTNDVVPVQDIGETLNHTFDEGLRYNVILAYEDNNGDRDTSRLVYQGTPGREVVTATYTVPLTDNQLVTSPEYSTTDLASCDAPPIPEADSASGQHYNVVEVRLVLW